MTTTQTHAGAHGSHLNLCRAAADGGFDIWRDYMELGGVLRRLCDGREGGHRGATEGPKRATPGPRGRFQTAVLLEDSSARDSLETSSVSSGSSSNVSDTGGSGSNASDTGGSSSGGGTPSSDLCRFCWQNGESAQVYRSHRLKSGDGRVLCPILWSYTCPICEATGDNAHTRRYCPRLRRQETHASELSR